MSWWRLAGELRGSGGGGGGGESGRGRGRSEILDYNGLL